MRAAPNELELELLRQYEAGTKMGQLGEEYNLSRQAVSQKIRKAYAYVYGELPRRLERPSNNRERRKQAAIALYRDGVSRSAIQRQLHMAPPTLASIIAEAGLPARICQRCKQEAPVFAPFCAACKEQRTNARLTLQEE